MKNFQKLAMGMLVATLAIGFSAFKEAKPFATIYYQLSPGQYSSNPGAGVGCVTTTANPCTINFSPALPTEVTSFNYSEVEELEQEHGSTASESGQKRLWE